MRSAFLVVALLARAAALRLVYVHGVSPEGPAHPRLAKVREAVHGVEVVAPDITGGGDSYEQCTISAALRVLHSCCEAEEGPVSICASSFGAFVALLFAARHPEKVSRLFLLGPALDMKANLPLFVDEDGMAAWREEGVREMGPGVRVGWPWAQEILDLAAGDCPPQPLCPITLVMPESDVPRAKGFLDATPAAAAPRRVLATQGWKPYQADAGIEAVLPHLTAWAEACAEGSALGLSESGAGYTVDVLPAADGAVSAADAAAAAASPERESVRRLQIRPEDVDGFHKSWRSHFPPSHEIHSYNAREDPAGAARAVAASFAHATKWLPSDVVSELLDFPFSADAPAALLLSGLPVDEAPPDTPIVSAVHGIGTELAQPRVPVAESWTLGLARLLGHPFVPPFFDKGHRGGLVRDMVPVPGVENLCGLLGLHRDFPASVFAPFPEPETFLLVAVRGDPSHVARTVVVDSEKLIASLSAADVALLSKHEMQAQVVLPNGQGAVDQGAPFLPIAPREGRAAAATLFVPDAGAHGEGAVGRMVSPEGGAEVEAAWERMMAVGLEVADYVDLQAGDCLILNNVRCCHGRTAFEPKLDGNDRWLVKSYVTSDLWKRPATGKYGAEAYPNMVTRAVERVSNVD